MLAGSGAEDHLLRGDIHTDARIAEVAKTILGRERLPAGDECAGALVPAAAGGWNSYALNPSQRIFEI